MKLLDTHAWLWLASDPDRLSPVAAKAIAEDKRLAIAAISCWEFADLLRRGAIGLDREPLEWMEQSIAEFGLELLPLTPAIAVRASLLGPGFKGDPVDRLIVATAMVHALPLITSDPQIRTCQIVESLW